MTGSFKLGSLLNLYHASLWHAEMHLRIYHMTARRFQLVSSGERVSSGRDRHLRPPRCRNYLRLTPMLNSQWPSACSVLTYKSFSTGWRVACVIDCVDFNVLLTYSYAVFGTERQLFLMGRNFLLYY